MFQETPSIEIFYSASTLRLSQVDHFHCEPCRHCVSRVCIFVPQAVC